MEKVSKKVLILLTLLLLTILSPVAFAEGDLDAIKEPIDKIYDLVKYLVSAIALIIITFAGVKFMTSGDNVQTRDSSKSMLTYAVIGLMVIWIAPPLVNYLTAGAP